MIIAISKLVLAYLIWDSVQAEARDAAVTQWSSLLIVSVWQCHICWPGKSKPILARLLLPPKHTILKTTPGFVCCYWIYHESNEQCNFWPRDFQESVIANRIFIAPQTSFICLHTYACLHIHSFVCYILFNHSYPLGFSSCGRSEDILLAKRP